MEMKTMNIKTKWRAALIVSSLLFLSFFAANMGATQAKKQANPTIKIAALGPLAITTGIDLRDAQLLAVKEINDAGGFDVAGTTYDFELIVETTSGEDGNPSVSKGTESLNKLTTQDNVTAIVGGFRTEVVMAMMATLGKTPFLGLGSTAPILTPYFWRVSPVNGTVLAYCLLGLYGTYLGPVKGVNKITIVREDLAWTLPLEAAAKGALTLQLGPLMGINYTFGETIDIAYTATAAQVSSAMSGLKDSDSDAIMHVFSAPVGKYVTEAWASLNLTQTLAGINVESQKSRFFYETDGAAYGEIELETAPPGVEPTNKTAPMKAAFSAEYGREPVYSGVGGYDAVYLLKAAYEIADNATKEGLQKALAEVEYTGATGKLAFTSEVGPQKCTADNGTKVLCPGSPAENSITVHDLFTPAGIMTRGVPFIQPYFGQWQKDGVKKVVWPNTTVSSPVLGTLIDAPVDHSDPGVVEDPDVTTGAGIPGFELLLVFSTLITTVILRRRRRK